MLALRDVCADLPDILDIDNNPVLTHLIRDDAKPGRVATKGVSRWVAHAGAAWSAHRFESSPAAIAPELAHETVHLIAEITGRPLDPSSLIAGAWAHRWGFAHPGTATPESYLIDHDLRIAICGDGWGGMGVESAFLSGAAAAEAITRL